MCVELIKEMGNLAHKLHKLLTKRVYQVRKRKKRTNGPKYYNFKCKSERKTVQ